MGEREMDHMATVDPAAPGENYSLLIIGVSNGDGDGGGVDGDGSGAISRPGRVPQQRLMSPESCRRWQQRSGPVEEILNIVRLFLGQEVFMGERAMSVGARGAHTTSWRGQDKTRATG